MIDLTSLKIYIDFRPDFKESKDGLRNYKKKIREDGLIEFTEDGSQMRDIQIKTNQFRVNIHNIDYPNEDKTRSWDFVLPVLKEYFTYKAYVKNLKILCGRSCFDFELGIYREEPEQSEQDDMFIANYTDWVFLQFDYPLETLFIIPEFCKLLNNKHHVHQVSDRGWPQTVMFLEKLTVDSFEEAFQRLIKLINMEKDIYVAMCKTRDEFYKKHEDLWIENLEGK